MFSFQAIYGVSVVSGGVMRAGYSINQVNIEMLELGFIDY